VTGIGEPLIGRFLIYDALKMRFRELKLKKDPECPVCGPNPTVTKLIDYEQFCGVRPEPAQAQTTGATVNEWEITPVDLKKKLDAGDTPFILDVREPNEYQINRIPGSTLIPLGELPQRQGAGFPQIGGVHQREEPQGWNPGVDRQGRSVSAEVLTPGPKNRTRPTAVGT